MKKLLILMLLATAGVFAADFVVEKFVDDEDQDDESFGVDDIVTGAVIGTVVFAGLKVIR